MIGQTSWLWCIVFKNQMLEKVKRKKKVKYDLGLVLDWPKKKMVF